MGLLKEEILKCDKCILRDACREPIPGDGNFSSKILII
jgi:uracil-DNA glycosylase